MGFSGSRYMPKLKIVTFRADDLTMFFLNELMKDMKKTKLGDVIRTCIMFTIILHSSRCTVKKVFKKEFYEKLMKGEDFPITEGLKPLNELYKIAFED
jgi:hypothetical protein